MSLNPSDPGPHPSEAAPAPDEDLTPRPRLGVVGFIIPVAVVAAAGTAALVYYGQAVSRATTVAGLNDEARRAAKRFDLASLKTAQAKADEVLDLDPAHPIGLSYAALVRVEMMQHGLDRRAEAEALVRTAAGAGVDTPVIRAVSGYLDILGGQPDKAERALSPIIDAGRGAPIVAHALGWAQAERGRYAEGRGIIRQAIERDFTAVAYRLTLAELAHRQGKLRRALSQLQAAYGERGNPKLLLAKAWGAALLPQVTGAYAAAHERLAEVEASRADAGPRTLALLEWARGELALAVGDVQTAQQRADAAAAQLPGFAPVSDLLARAALKAGDRRRAVELYEQAVSAKPEYRGSKWAFARLKSDMGDPSALDLVAELESSAPQPGPEYDVFRGEHHLRRGQLERARARFAAAAETSQDPAALFGLARVTYEEEKRKGARADVGAVARQLDAVLARRRSYPEVYAYVGDLQLDQGRLQPADDNYRLAEKDYLTENRPIPEVLGFYDRVVARLERPTTGVPRSRARALARRWGARKRTYLSSVTATATAPNSAGAAP